MSTDCIQLSCTSHFITSVGAAVTTQHNATSAEHERTSCCRMCTAFSCAYSGTRCTEPRYGLSISVTSSNLTNQPAPPTNAERMRVAAKSSNFQNCEDIVPTLAACCFLAGGSSRRELSVLQGGIPSSDRQLYYMPRRRGFTRTTTNKRSMAECYAVKQLRVRFRNCC